MIMIREFVSNFTRAKRTPLIALHLLLPVAVTLLFFVYYAFAGYHIISDVRLFFVIIQICYPVFVSIVVPILINLDRNINNVQNVLGVVDSRSSVYLGKLFFLLILSAINIILYELCFYIGINLFLDIRMTNFGSYTVIFYICFISSLFLYILHVLIAFRFGSSISLLLGISGTIMAGFFENAIGDNIWPMIPWEWGVRFLKRYFNLSCASIYPGILFLVITALVLLIVSILWFNRWEGKITQE